MIKRLVLKNWKTHYDTSLEFVSGTNVIVGKIGSGKSSVLDAVSYALFGTFPSLSSRKVVLEEVIMARPSRQNNALVELEFFYNGRNYSVKRIIKRNGVNEAELRENGKLIAGPKTTDVNKKIEEVLEVSYDLFSRAIYSEQNQLDAFLKMAPGQRKEKLDELLGLDKYEKARSNALSLSTRLKKLAEDKKKFAQEQSKKIDLVKLEDYRKKYLEKEREVRDLESRFASLEKSVVDKKQNLECFEKLEKQHVELEKQVISLSSKLSSLREQCDNIKKKLSGLSFEQLAAKKDSLLGQIKALNDKKMLLKKELDDSRANLVSVREEKAGLMSDLGGVKKSISNIDAIHGSCPVCKRPIGEHEKEVIVSEFLAERKRLESLVSEKDALISEKEKVVVEINSKINSVEKNLDSLNNEFFEVNSLFVSASELNEKLKSVEELEQQLSFLKSKSESLGFDREKLDFLREDHFKALADFEKVKTQLKSSKELLVEINKSISIFESSLKSIALLEEEAKLFSSCSELASVFVNALVAAQVELREVMIENINFAMNEIWPKIYPYGDIKQISLALVDGNYEVFARTSGDELIRVEGILSGGERSCVAITLRIALSLVLTSNLGWIMLDEPTHNLDSSAVNKFALTIGERLPEIIDQVFIITHDKSLEVAGTGKLYYFEREKDSYGSTKVF